jgi:diguanylate cyclase (GGDEF)-like protein
MNRYMQAEKFQKGKVCIQDFERIIMFDGVALENVFGLLENCPIRQVASNEVLITEGSDRKECYLILSGSLRIHLGSPDSDAISRLGVGESVGELALLDGKSASAFVVADEPCQLLVLHEDIFWSLINASHNFARNLIILLSRRMRGSNATIFDGVVRQHEYRRTAVVDELTGLHNRRWMHEILDRQMKRSQMNHEPLSLLMLDIDHFKSINDNFGHLAGDQVIRAVAQKMMVNVRPTDLLVRFGGEEFIVVLPLTDLAGARIVAQRICASVRHAKIVDGSGNELPSTTISIGIAQMTANESQDNLIERADQIMYKAKSNGRDRVES